MSGPGSGDGFQSFVNKELPPGVAGDFAGANIRANIIAGAFGYAASPAGLTVGLGGWANPATKVASNYYQPQSFKGFVGRKANNGIITNFLGVASMLVEGGDMCTLFDQGEFWGLFAAGATVGQKVYFDPVTGALTANATGQGVTASNTGASIMANVLTTTDADATGTVAVGQVVTGVGVPPGTYIASADGTGSGTHLWNLANVDGTAIPNLTSQTMNFQGVIESQYSVASPVTVDADFTAAIAAPVLPSNFGIMTVSAVASGVIVPGQFLSATGLPGSQNVQVLEQLTVGSGVGGTGTYLTTYSGAAAINSTNSFVGTQGKLGKISSWVS